MTLRSTSGAFGPVAITSGSISGVTGVPVILTAGGIPFIGLSSGSVAANGAISAITALPAVYPDAYCYFPANKLAAVSAAGFYYCQFTTTTAGTAFLNAYTSGRPTIPASPTAVTAGQGAFTGDITEEFGLTLTIPAMTATSALRLMVREAANNTANAKTLNVRLSGNAGTVMFAHGCVSNTAFGFSGLISNTGAVAKQISTLIGGGLNSNPTDSVLNTIDLSTGTATLVFSMTRATATDNFVLLPPTVELLA